jgi:hypothetical protein
MTSETPAWLSRVLLHWRFSNWPVIAGVAGTVLSIGVLVLVAGSLRSGVPVPADIRLSSASNEPSWTAVSQPEVAVIPVGASVSRTSRYNADTSASNARAADECSAAGADEEAKHP